MKQFQPDTPVHDDEFDDPIEVFASFDLADDVVDLFRQFGAENAATALISRIFWFDADCHLVWDTQFKTQRPTAFEAARDNALIYGLLTLVAGPVSQTFDDDIFSEANSLARWQRTTRDLLRLHDSEQPAEPWLYGWAQFGVDLCQEARGPRIALRNRALARAIDPKDPPFDAFADQLPASLDELVELPGIGPKTAHQTERRLVEMVLEPTRYAPTMEEMMSPDFEPCPDRDPA